MEFGKTSKNTKHPCTNLLTSSAAATTDYPSGPVWTLAFLSHGGIVASGPWNLRTTLLGQQQVNDIDSQPIGVGLLLSLGRIILQHGSNLAMISVVFLRSLVQLGLFGSALWWPPNLALRLFQGKGPPTISHRSRIHQRPDTTVLRQAQSAEGFVISARGVCKKPATVTIQRPPGLRNCPRTSLVCWSW